MNKSTKWMNLKFAENGLFTVDLMDGETIVENVGGTYQRAMAAKYNATATWAKKHFPLGPVWEMKQK